MHALASAYEKALGSDEPEDSEVQLAVIACDAAGNELGEVGVAACSLEQLVSSGKDHHGPLPITAPDGTPAGELACSIGAVASLTPVAVAKGKAPIALLLSRVSAKAAVQVAATALSLDAAARPKRGASNLALLVRLGGKGAAADEPLASSTAPLASDGTCDFGLKASLKASAGAGLTRGLLHAIDVTASHTHPVRR